MAIGLRPTADVLTVWALIFLAMPAVSGTDGSPTQAVITFVAEDYSFRGPDRIPAGLITLRIVNKGLDFHHLQLVKLPPGKTAKEFQSTVRAEGVLPTWIGFSGGPNSPMPGGESMATLYLDPGHYVLICLIPNQNGTSHLALGMVKPITVEGPSHDPRKRRQEDLVINQVDFAFVLSGPVKAGPQTVRVRNHGTQPHEVVVVRLETGASVEDFATYRTASRTARPGEPIGGITVIDTGREASFTVSFAPGRYGLLCFVHDPETGAPHVSRGMMTEFMVRAGPRRE